MTKINEDGSYAEWPEPATVVYLEPDLDNIACDLARGDVVHGFAYVVIDRNNAVHLKYEGGTTDQTVPAYEASQLGTIYATQEAAIRGCVECEKAYMRDMTEKIKTVEDYLAGLKP